MTLAQPDKMSDNESVHAPPVPIAPVVNADAVELLTGALERVQSGDTVTLALVEVKRNRKVSFGTAFVPNGCYHLLNSGAALLLNLIASQRD